MKEKLKRIFINSIIIFIICFLFLHIFQAYEDFDFYSKYSKEDFIKFFSIKEIIIWNLWQSFNFGIKQMILSFPILAVLEKIKLKNVFKIMICLVFVFAINAFYYASTFEMVF